MPIGISQQFVASAVYSDGSSQDLVSGVTWTSSLPSAATIDANGGATTLAAGTTTITATVGSLTDSTTLTVAPTWHDQRTGENTGTLCASPAHGLQELVRPILFPVAEKQFRLRSQRVQNFRA